MAPLIGARDRFTPWVACERSGMAPSTGARDRFTPWVACERSRMAPLELAALGVAEARERIGRGTLSPVALVEACLERIGALDATVQRSEEHTSELQSPCNLVCRLLLEKKKKKS